MGYIAIGLFLVFTTVAMIMYPGGTIHDSSTEGYQFFYNFFSNLGDLYGQLEMESQIKYQLDLFNSALMLLALSYFIFYYQFLKILSKALNNSFLRILLISTIIVSMVSFVLVAVFSGETETRDLHVLFVKIAFRVLLLHGVLHTGI